MYKLNEYRKVYTGNILIGIELNTVYDGVSLHMLCYDFDYNKLNKWIEENYEKRKPDLKLEFESIIQNCRKNNIKIGNIEYDESKGWPVEIIYPEIKKYPENKKYFKEDEWNDIDVFFESCITNKDFPAFVDFSIHYPTADIVAKEVRKAGGKAFIAHVFEYRLENTFDFLDLLKNNNIIDGIEVYHSSFTQEQISALEEYCKNNNLLMSGGSDCHGEKKQDIKIGLGYGNLNISKDILNDWKK